MAKSVGNVAKSSSRLCFTFVSVTTPTAPRTPLPTKFAVAEKHTARLLRCEDCACHCRTQNISYDAARSAGLRITGGWTALHSSCFDTALYSCKHSLSCGSVSVSTDPSLTTFHRKNE